MFRRHREQARSHSLICGCPGVFWHGTTLWERACSRLRWVSLSPCWMCRRHREQALLPQFGSVPACDFPANKNPLWEQSLLAIAVGQFASMLNVPAPSRANPLPQFDLWLSWSFLARHDPVGASLLGIAVGQFASMLNVPAPSRASSLPQFDLWLSWNFLARHNPVGASLLAIAVGQLESMLDVPPSSRASFAPTVWIGASLRFSCQQKSPVGAKLARDSGGSVCINVECSGAIASKLAPTV